MDPFIIKWLNFTLVAILLQPSSFWVKVVRVCTLKYLVMLITCHVLVSKDPLIVQFLFLLCKTLFTRIRAHLEIWVFKFRIVCHMFITFLYCRFLIIMGVILLVSSTRLLRHLPWPLRHFIQSGVDRNFSLRRSGSGSGSVRARDTNPSAVIQAATLHHLISSPSKEKPWIDIVEKTVAYPSLLRFLLACTWHEKQLHLVFI